MKNIFLIGDSIRFGASANSDYNTSNSPGYGVYLEEMLRGKANVYAPNDNCRFLQYTLRYLYDWTLNIDREKIDVVHWNNGLWDCTEIFDDGLFTSEEEYIENMLRVATLLKKTTPNVIFATTTPVWDEFEWTHNDRIERFNEIIVPRLKEIGVKINDLHALVSQDVHKYIKECDKIHLSDEGIELCANAVVDAIKSFE